MNWYIRSVNLTVHVFHVLLYRIHPSTVGPSNSLVPSHEFLQMTSVEGDSSLMGWSLEGIDPRDPGVSSSFLKTQLSNWFMRY